MDLMEELKRVFEKDDANKKRRELAKERGLEHSSRDVWVDKSGEKFKWTGEDFKKATSKDEKKDEKKKGADTKEDKPKAQTTPKTKITPPTGIEVDSIQAPNPENIKSEFAESMGKSPDDLKINKYGKELSYDDIVKDHKSGVSDKEPLPSHLADYLNLENPNTPSQLSVSTTAGMISQGKGMYKNVPEEYRQYIQDTSKAAAEHAAHLATVKTIARENKWSGSSLSQSLEFNAEAQKAARAISNSVDFVLKNLEWSDESEKYEWKGPKDESREAISKANDALKQAQDALAAVTGKKEGTDEVPDDVKSKFKEKDGKKLYDKKSGAVYYREGDKWMKAEGDEQEEVTDDSTLEKLNQFV